MQNIYQWLPGVDELLLNERIKAIHDVPRQVILDGIRNTLKEYRHQLGVNPERYQHKEELQRDILNDIIKEIARREKPQLRKVINATGIVLHTNLGRALLSGKAWKSVEIAATGYSNLELNLATGHRGSRYAHVEELITRLTGAESCLVVNNNAAAVLLALNTLAKGKETIVSRGELVEIGGSFRIPDVMEQSGSHLVEVGTTNKTYRSDYEQKIGSETSLLLKVHTSNYRIIGFTQETDIKDLVTLGKEFHLPVMHDLGSGSLFDLKGRGIGDEPTVQQIIASGADVVTFSGDKLLGGPQAGIIAGKDQYISLMKKNPLTRALRIDKMTVAALEATLRSYLDMEGALQEIPTLEMLTRPLNVLKEQAQELKALIAKELTSFMDISVEEGVSQVGGGSLPGKYLPTYLVLLKLKKQKVEQFVHALREGEPGVLTYVRDDQVILDPRTVLASQYECLVSALKKGCGGK
ncbi:L-seryl-tRNA(Sec) selenium transferase [Dehalobacterium formicoaceticum]|uniref:L-seryl-tRNA(Sec) selenium transferase n=1 Tax=Dehalobacterium formicoaceticum TaxID=51515 RepID=A0ABT1Y435_9FIRM|nr:L-seryl-tRNA(Sec) selenium transferase [Dehalobacterium formicoaceticum]MCR6545631.1 L-seryl-tRNA(Sec) selenium transferase [Dehalobacterium formicoaceticum]